MKLPFRFSRHVCIRHSGRSAPSIRGKCSPLRWSSSLTLQSQFHSRRPSSHLESALSSANSCAKRDTDSILGFVSKNSNAIEIIGAKQIKLETRHSSLLRKPDKIWHLLPAN